MATMALSLVGGAVGFAVGGPLGARVGFAAGNMLGNALFTSTETFQQEGPRIQSLRLQGSSAGQPIPIIYGRGGHAGHIIWKSAIREVVVTDTQSSGGKGGGGGSEVESTTYQYYVDIAVACCEGEKTITNIWADDLLIWNREEGAKSGLPEPAVYTGAEDQAQDALIVADKGVDDTPAYRGLVYAVWEDFPLHELFFNRIPQFFFECDGEVEEFEETQGGLTFVGFGAPVSAPQYPCGVNFASENTGCTVQELNQDACNACGPGEFAANPDATEGQSPFDEDGPDGYYITGFDPGLNYCSFYQFTELGFGGPGYTVTSEGFGFNTVPLFCETGNQKSGASVDIDGTLAIIGAPGRAADGTSSEGSGAAQLYEDTGGGGLTPTTLLETSGVLYRMGQAVGCNDGSNSTVRWVLVGFPGITAVSAFVDSGSAWGTSSPLTVVGSTGMGEDLDVDGNYAAASEANGDIEVFHCTGVSLINVETITTGGTPSRVRIRGQVVYALMGSSVSIWNGDVNRQNFVAGQTGIGATASYYNVSVSGNSIVVSSSILNKAFYYVWNGSIFAKVAEITNTDVEGFGVSCACSDSWFVVAGSSEAAKYAKTEGGVYEQVFVPGNHQLDINLVMESDDDNVLCGSGTVDNNKGGTSITL